MSKTFRVVALLLTLALPTTVTATAVSANAAAAATPQVKTTKARFGSRFGRRAPTSRYRSPSWTRRPYRRTYRRSPFGGVFGGVLKALGIAYLVHALFGWGGGGSPFGMLLLVALTLWVATRRTRRRTPRW